MPLVVEWSAKGIEPTSSVVTTGLNGQATLAYPAGQPFRNRSVRLKISTDFARSASGSSALQSIDDARKRSSATATSTTSPSSSAPKPSFPAAPSPPAPCPGTNGPARKEAPRQAQTSDFFIDVYPVTNALYEMFLDDTGSETFPEYWDNPAYNQPDQPVIGVSLEDANRFATVAVGAARRRKTAADRGRMGEGRARRART